MNGTIRYIRTKYNECSLIDEDGVERKFTRDAVVVSGTSTVEQTLGAHDAVSFSLDGNRVYDVTLVKKHSDGVVFSW